MASRSYLKTVFNIIEFNWKINWLLFCVFYDNIFLSTFNNQIKAQIKLFLVKAED